jgi:hypothetical protein
MARLKFKDGGGGVQHEEDRIEVVGKMMNLEQRWRMLVMKKCRGKPKER